MTRADGRVSNQLRKLEIIPGFLSHPAGSVLYSTGGTRVICAASLENSVPPWMKAQKVSGGWATSEYGMLPASTHDRMKREASHGKQSGRTVEIQRLIGRSLRAVVDLEKLEGHTLHLDCDVIDADGGTRCASISGAAVAAVSVGIVNGEPVLDLNYLEDSNAEVDMNIIMTESMELIEVQGTAEGAPFSRKQLNELIDLAEVGIKEIFAAQRKILAAHGIK